MSSFHNSLKKTDKIDDTRKNKISPKPNSSLVKGKSYTKVENSKKEQQKK